MVSDADQAALPPAVLLMGPTAAGKTGLALQLAEVLPVELISVDSAQVYRGLDIGSAKPDPATLKAFPHALIDIRDPEDNYSAADFLADAEQAMHRASAAGRMPLLVGGTMMYFRALLYGLDQLPAADPALRAQLQAWAEREGWRRLHRELARIDPLTAASVRPSDPQRIQRALEIYQLSGRRPSDLRAGRVLPRFRALKLVVCPGYRHILHARIADRLEAMMSAGFVDEVKRLRQRPQLHADCAAMKSVGYRQAWNLLDGELDMDQFHQRTLAATRQLAKRQLTALRQMADALWYDPSRNGVNDRIFRQVEGFSRHLVHLPGPVPAS